MIDDDQERRIIRRFKVLVALETLSMLMVAALFLYTTVVSRGVLDVAKAVKTNTESVATVKANQDLYRQQYLDYIHDMIDAVSKLQRENPQLKVPPAPRTRLPTLNKPKR